MDPLTALAVRMLVRTTLRFCVLYTRCQDADFGHPALGGNLVGVRRVLRFATAQLGFSLTNLVARNVDTILVGRILGAAPLGIYDKTLQLMRHPLMLITVAITPAFQPVLRRCAGELGSMERLHRGLAVRLAYAGVAASVVIVPGAEPIVRLLFGPDRDAVIPVLRVLARAIPLQVSAASSGGFSQATGRPNVMLASGAVSALRATSEVVVLSSNVVDRAWSLVVASHPSFGQNYVLLYAPVFREPSWNLARPLAVPALLHALNVSVALALTARS